MGRRALEQVACVAKPNTILAWYRRLVAQKFDGSRQRSYPGRPPVQHEIVELVVQMARENPGWGYDRIVGALANLGHVVSDHGRPRTTFLFFLHLETRRVSLAGIARHPTETWMEQMARNTIAETFGHLLQHSYVLHDRDTKFCALFRAVLATGNVKCLALPAAQSESERIRRTLGAIRQAGMPFKADPVRGETAGAVPSDTSTTA
jgi:hypothetical protein